MEKFFSFLAVVSVLGAAGSGGMLIYSIMNKNKIKKPLIILASCLVICFLSASVVGYNTVVNSVADRDYKEPSSSPEHESKYVEGIGTLTVVKDIYPEETITLNQMSATVNAIKIFRVDDPEGSFKADIERYKGEPVGDTFYYMTINFTGDNSSLMNLEWYGLASISLDDGTWLNQEDDDLLNGQDENGNDITPDYYGETSKEYTHMYVIDSPDVNAVELEFDAVTGASSGVESAPATTETYYFD
ncbi:hypothetical protein CPT_Moonbeam222 [Bacillus phage Moonbeam]|uniref:Uncharacterized protein n=1 Tax=Bacillus phage Moonbeam TaxID=1540091 RepID=A0A0A0RNE2_9CAUD|nr:hypothetical protein CPT_Moonbeam222 [Bacillus phage Moonbeam]AIW03620.1 hypothetical protein CPT_Moonbeam222 [Bacillus phage Moonbeam]